MEVEEEDRLNTHYTSDPHFDHKAIIGYCNRPFADVEEMNLEIIGRWNGKVQPEDEVYHLGDLTMGGSGAAGYFFSKLNGHIRILANEWHHDKRWLRKEGQVYFSKSGQQVEILPPMVVLRYPEFSVGKHPWTLVLCHYPLVRWDRRHYGAGHLHGHCHGRYKGDGLCMDVGVDCNDFAPVELSEVVENFKVQ